MTGFGMENVMKMTMRVKNYCRFVIRYWSQNQVSLLLPTDYLVSQSHNLGLLLPTDLSSFSKSQSGIKYLYLQP